MGLRQRQPVRLLPDSSQGAGFRRRDLPQNPVRARGRQPGRHAFEDKDIAALKGGPSFLDEIIWEKDYLPIDWKRVPYRKTLTDFMKQIDEVVIVPANFGAFATIKEAMRLLALGGRFTSLDAGTPDKAVLSSPDKPCYGLYGGQYSFIVNFALCDEVARHLGIKEIAIEPQQEFVSRMLGVNVLTVVDLLEAYHSLGRLT